MSSVARTSFVGAAISVRESILSKPFSHPREGSGPRPGAPDHLRRWRPSCCPRCLAPPWHAVRRCRSPAAPPPLARDRTTPTVTLSRTPPAPPRACSRIRDAMICGSDRHFPRHTRLPPRRIATAVSSSDTSSPIYSTHGCSPSDVWARLPEWPATFIYRGTATSLRIIAGSSLPRLPHVQSGRLGGSFHKTGVAT